MDHRIRSTAVTILTLCALAVGVRTSVCAAKTRPRATLGASLSGLWDRADAGEHLAIWVYLRDKGPGATTEVPLDAVSQRSLRRRAKVLPPGERVDAHDLPVYVPYVDDIAGRVARVRQRSKWFNAVSVLATRAQITALRSLDCVRHLELVLRTGRSDDLEVHGVDDAGKPSTPAAPDKLNAPSVPHRFDYGMSLAQLDISNIPLMHSLGYDGSGVLVGHFDNGHRLMSHEVFQRLDVLSSWDFVDHDADTAPDPSDPRDFGAHGVSTLSILAGFKEGRVIGPAFAATYLLARTENDAIEAPGEEDNWVAAIEWADSMGVEVVSTSLGYRDFDDGSIDWTWEDMDGNTTLITRAADMAVARGIVVVTGVGNEGLSEDRNTILAPADGDSVIAVGAVNDLGELIGFTSYGPTADGRTKPDVLALGSGTAMAQAGNERHYGVGDGTSLATPLVAGTAALLLQAHPWATPLQIRDALRLTASRADAVDRFEGWGTIDAYAAFVYLRKIGPPPTSPFAGRPAYIVPNVLRVLPLGTIRYKLDVDAHVTLQVFDVRGRLVRRLLSAPQAADLHELTWDGLDDHGAATSAGVFFVRLRAQSLLQPQRVSTFTSKLLRIE
jgi:subtilisin family serine protease